MVAIILSWPRWEMSSPTWYDVCVVPHNLSTKNEFLDGKSTLFEYIFAR
jgi:hypothetical protein